MKGAIIIEGHVQGLANMRSLGRQGIPVILLNRERQCIAKHSKYCTRFFRCPEYDSDDLALLLLKIAEENQLKDWMILPSNDHAVQTLSRNRALLQDRYNLLVPSQDATKATTDKLRLSAEAKTARVPIPNTFSTTGFEPHQIRYPCLIKGRYGLNFYKATGCKAIVCRDDKDLSAQLKHPALQADPDMAMVQELVGNQKDSPTISVAVFCDQGEVKTLWMGKKVREHPFQFGTATLTESVYVPQLAELTRSLMRQLRYQGIAEVEFIYDPTDDVHKLIEVNPRTWLWVGHAMACGIDFPFLAWQHHQGNEMKWPESYPIGLQWRNFYPDLYFGMKAILQRKISLGRWLKETKRSIIPAVWSRQDPLPFVMLTAMLPLITLQRQR
jgi:D-aspartate ligase